MPKETLVLKDFTTGLVGSEHGSDLPDNAIAEGGNLNVNRKLGLLELAGRYEKAFRADDVNYDGTSEQFTTPGNFIGFRGRGLFYFSSDYSGLANTASTDWSNRFDASYAGAGSYIGPKSEDDFPTEYYVYASRHANSPGFDTSPGYTSSTFHIYCLDRNTRVDLYGNNLGYADDGTYNGHVMNFPMGSYSGGGYNDNGDPTYSENWFPVYYWANGALRICDGGFLEQNSAKVYLGYERDNVLFNGLTANAADGQVDTSGFKVDNWIIDKGGNTDATYGMLYAPEVATINPSSQGDFDAALLSHVGVENKVILLGNEWSMGMASPGESFPAIDYTNGHPIEIDILHEGCIACSLHVRAEGSQFGDTVVMSSANIILPQNGENKEGWSLYVSYIYENNQESSLTKFIDNGAVDANGNAISFDPSERMYGPNKRIDVHWQVNASLKKSHPRIKGAKLYIKSSEEQDSSLGGEVASDYYLISEMNFELGARSPGSSSYNDWYPARYITNSNSFICRNSLGNFSETFQSWHGYVPDDIKPCYYKTACVAYGKVYVGNVKFDGRLYPDRIMKSEGGEFDTFTKYGFIDILEAVDDGDSIVHLESFGDRILQFKENIVYIINISKQFEFVEMTAKYAGISNPSQVVQTDKGVYWANRRGLWWYNGEAVVNLLASRGLTISNKSARITAGELDDAIGSWEDVFLDDKDGAPVLSYDPINKDVIIMNQYKYETNRISDKDNCFLYTDAGDWTAFGGSVSHTGNALQVTVASGDQGAQLNAAKIDGLVNGETYRVEATLESHSDFSAEPIIRFKLGGVEADIQANVGNPARAGGITSSYLSYYADITITDSAQGLVIFNDASQSTDDAGVFNMKNVSVRPAPKVEDDIAFLWNTDRNNLTQLFHRTSRFGKSNSVITSSGDSIYLSVGKNYHNDGYDPAIGTSGSESSSGLRVWHSSAQNDFSSQETAADKRNLYLLTKAIDFDNHSRRKVIQSIHFTYKSNGSNYLVPFIKAYYLDGTSPATYYMCTATASGVGVSDLEASNWNGLLPTTGSKYKTYKYRHVLASGTTGDAASMRSKIKNVGAIQVGLVKLNVDNSLPAILSLEEIAITHRVKSAK